MFYTWFHVKSAYLVDPLVQMIAITHKLAGCVEQVLLLVSCQNEMFNFAYLVDPQNISLPPLHIKLGLMKN